MRMFFCVVMLLAFASSEADARLFQRLRNRGGCSGSGTPVRNVMHRAAGVFSGCNGGSCSVR